ncbi:MAG: hypothetical protein ACRDSJ_15460 [Rubrobacteraceae bacterium]
MTGSDNTRYSSGEPKPQWLIDFENEMRTPGKAPREPFGHPRDVPQLWAYHLFDGAWAQLWHEPHAGSYEIRGLRPVSDGGPLGLVLDNAPHGLQAARPADGSVWTTDPATDVVGRQEDSVVVSLWPVDDTETLTAPSDLPDWQIEEWHLRTARRKIDL